MDLYFKTMKLNKDHVYLYELKGHTKHLNIFINKANVFIIIPTHSPKCQVLVCPLDKWKFKTELETHEMEV